MVSLYDTTCSSTLLSVAVSADSLTLSNVAVSADRFPPVHILELDHKDMVHTVIELTDIANLVCGTQMFEVA